MQKIFARCAKVLLNFFFQDNSSKLFFWTRTITFRQIFRNVPPVDWSFFGQPPKKILRIISSPNSSFGHIECNPDNHNERKNFRQKSLAYSFSVRKRLKLLFQARVFSLKISLWPHIRQFWQIWLKIFA